MTALRCGKTADGILPEHKPFLPGSRVPTRQRRRFQKSDGSHGCAAGTGRTAARSFI